MKKRKSRGKPFLVFLLSVITVLIVTACSTDVLLEMIYPVKYQEYVETYADEYDLDPYLVYAIIKVESGFDPEAKSKAGAMGLMQVMEETAIECNEKAGFGYNIPEDLSDPEVNIRIGCYYLNSLYNIYGDMKLAVTAYNGGTGNVDEWIRDAEFSDGKGGLAKIPYKETRRYVEKVFDTFDTYCDLYNKNKTIK